MPGQVRLADQADEPMLGHSEPAVPDAKQQSAVPTALERLAQDNPGHRQTIVNVVCAYLRMPFALPGQDL
jgi:hypothetical protein